MEQLLLVTLSRHKRLQFLFLRFGFRFRFCFRFRLRFWFWIPDSSCSIRPFPGPPLMLLLDSEGITLRLDSAKR